VFASKYSGGTCKIEREQDVRSNIRLGACRYVASEIQTASFISVLPPSSSPRFDRGGFRDSRSAQRCIVKFFLLFFFSASTAGNMRCAAQRQLDERARARINRVDELINWLIKKEFNRAGARSS